MEFKMNETTKTLVRPPFEHAKLEAGILGKFFGTQNNASCNIAGITIFLLIISMFIVMAVNFSYGLSYLEKISPLIALSLGYLFGKNS
ncbi:hypothetical protein SOV_22360 [Sporomusa ovata DSM 2662]|uniref:hypothetical protein n=1 Tax=Sporomusa ovata TaxID=2378 RepID=UPI0003887110|nr:hypothetical protein [Sporomusa ovata]EQB25552.1 hypothetical protein SOV_4c02150 [Sporomusa ovata DSM 2662]